jgi:hypothetical protein
MTSPSARRLALAALLLAGCTKAFDTSRLDPLGSAEGYCQALYDAHYQFEVRCDGWDPAYALVRPKYWYQADCAPRASSVAAGRMTYDRASAEACLAAYAAADGCAEPRWVLPACQAAVAAAVPPGGECTWTPDCLAPSTCYSADLTCPGHCTSAGAPGDPCDAGALGCGPGLFCDGTARCAPRRRSGEACAGGDCLEGLSCDAGACSYVAGLGEPCGALPCDPTQDTYCDVTCQRKPGPGEACGLGQVCAAGLYCRSADLRCQRPPTAPVALGQPCAPPAFCAFDAFCDGTLPTPACAARKAVGQPCQTSDECLRPAACDTSGAPLDWRCAAPRVAGSPCDLTTRPCAQGAVCVVQAGDTGTCATAADFGQPCGQIGVGESTYCGPGACVTAAPADPVGVCRPLADGGAPCRDDLECRSSSCDTQAGRCRAPGCPLPY